MIMLMKTKIKMMMTMMMTRMMMMMILTLLIPSYSSLVCPAGSSYSPPSGPPEMGWVILLQLSDTSRLTHLVVTD